MKRYFLLLYMLLTTLVYAQQTTIILVRHAEQDKSIPNDPPLTIQGQARAELLATTLSKLPIAVAYTTDMIRAKATALPTAKANGAEIIHYKLEDDEGQFIKSLVQKHQHKNILLIGHSGNIAELLNAATQSFKYNETAIEGFSDFYILTFSDNKPALVTRLKYGQ